MTPLIRGGWASVFMSPAGNRHDFTLDLERGPEGAAAKMELVQHKPGGATLRVRFHTHVEICGGFVALLSKNAASGSVGVNAMILKVVGDSNVMEGVIVWNSLSTGTVECGIMKWVRVLP